MSLLWFLSLLLLRGVTTSYSWTEWVSAKAHITWASLWWEAARLKPMHAPLHELVLTCLLEHYNELFLCKVRRFLLHKCLCMFLNLNRWFHLEAILVQPLNLLSGAKEVHWKITVGELVSIREWVPTPDPAGQYAICLLGFAWFFSSISCYYYRHWTTDGTCKVWLVWCILKFLTAVMIRIIPARF